MNTAAVSARNADGPRAGVPPRAGLVLAALLIAAVVCNINFAAATVALPAIGMSYDASQTALNLVGLGTGLGLAMSVLYFGAVADRFGRKQLLLIGMVLTIVASLLSAFAPTIEILIGARVFTGLAAGMAYPTTLSLITALWAEGPKRTSAIALWASLGGMASVAGGVVAGGVLAISSWNVAFLLSIPVAIVAIILIMTAVPSHVDESTEPVDHLGGILSTIGIAALVLGIGVVLAPGGGTVGGVLIGGAVVFIGLFLWRQRVAKNPLYDLSVARRRLFWVPALAGTIAFGSLIGAMFVGEQFMQNILGYTPLGAGAAVIPAAVGLILMAPVSARIVITSGTRGTMLVGYAFIIVAFLTMLAWREGTPYWLIGIGFFVIGAGAAFVITASSRSLTSTTPVRRVGMASATSDLQNDLGGSIMQALLGAVLAGGFATAFADVLTSSGAASSIGPDVTRALQASFASAAHVATQYPQYSDDILEAARQSLVAGSLGAYLIGAVAIVIGAVVVWFGLPSRQKEAELRESYTRADS
ncbi:MFS transporter [Compostimonas suwonensis]|uniref:MFS transporter n=1 Tax=Compostimonas suwonensis TaxID=1048394 RepID=A0A2M9C4T4_9MICO|nr:MFS transporter [Compostimonas suwonensis]PJJ65538.1 MFS transporter [Compostimonas suwonensis]